MPTPIPKTVCVASVRVHTDEADIERLRAEHADLQARVQSLVAERALLQADMVAAAAASNALQAEHQSTVERLLELAPTERDSYEARIQALTEQLASPGGEDAHFSAEPVATELEECRAQRDAALDEIRRHIADKARLQTDSQMEIDKLHAEYRAKVDSEDEGLEATISALRADAEKALVERNSALQKLATLQADYNEGVYPSSPRGSHTTALTETEFLEEEGSGQEEDLRQECRLLREKVATLEAKQDETSIAVQVGRARAESDSARSELAAVRKECSLWKDRASKLQALVAHAAEAKAQNEVRIRDLEKQLAEKQLEGSESSGGLEMFDGNELFEDLSKENAAFRFATDEIKSLRDERDALKKKLASHQTDLRQEIDDLKADKDTLVRDFQMTKRILEAEHANTQQNDHKENAFLRDKCSKLTDEVRQMSEMIDTLLRERMAEEPVVEPPSMLPSWLTAPFGYGADERPAPPSRTISLELEDAPLDLQDNPIAVVNLTTNN